MREAGARVSFGAEGIKVHSKLIQIERNSANGIRRISYIGTGNFHEGNAKIYEDIGFLTASESIGDEVNEVFRLLLGLVVQPNFEKLIVSPFNTRKKLVELIKFETKQAKMGAPSGIRLKLNNLVDSELIRYLYEASHAGVKIDILCRGICCLVPGIEGLSENIHVRSIVGRYLEHSRFMIFHHGGEPQYFISSADWMERNLDKRVEVICPIEEPRLKQRLEDVFGILWKGNVKSRIIDQHQSNRYYRNGRKGFHSQEALYDYYVNLSAQQVGPQL